MWDPIVSVPDHCLSFYFATKLSVHSFYMIAKMKDLLARINVDL